MQKFTELKFSRTKKSLSKPLLITLFLIITFTILILSFSTSGFAVQTFTDQHSLNLIKAQDPKTILENGNVLAAYLSIISNESQFEKSSSSIDPCKDVKSCGKCGNPACITSKSSSSKSLSSISSLSTTSQSSAYICDRKIAEDLLKLMNDWRIQNGKGILIWDEKISIAACNHSKWQAINDNFNHMEGNIGPADRCKLAGTTCKSENIAWRNNISAQSVFHSSSKLGWQVSPSHNATMLGPFTKVGIGFYSKGIKGFATADFD